MSSILVVEDDAALCDLLRSQLEADGYTVMQAFNGIEALKLVEQNPPGLIILDWMLPGMDGLAVCRRLRQRYLIPIIMLTARTEEIDYVLGLEAGADDYIQKPFRVRQLLARVRAILRRVELYSQPSLSPLQPPVSAVTPTLANISPPLVRGLLTIYFAERKVMIDNKKIELAPKEFDLLALLVSHPNWVFKREILLQQVWGDTYEGFDRTVDNHITRLRKKLGPMGEKIDTVWGVGYRFIVDR